jgi:enolase
VEKQCPDLNKNMSKIKEVKSREILDSRGNPTIETKVTLDNGLFAKASVPSGASTGKHEALEMRDRDPKRYHGLGVLRAIENVNKKIGPKLLGMNVADQQAIDQAMIELDGSSNKMNLGANAILSVSLAVARAASVDKGVELFQYIKESYSLGEASLPTPCFNIFNGGKHADTNLDFQEFMVIPLKKASLSEKVRMGAEIFHELGKVLKKGGFDTDVGNEGGYAPDIISSVQAIEFIISAAINAGYKPRVDFGLGIDVGSSELFDEDQGKYIFKLDNAFFTNSNLIGLYNEWLKDFPIISIEDGLAEDEWGAWKELTAELGGKLMLVGDDLFTTNTDRLRKGLKEKAANAILIKPNQVGTLSETMECVKLAQKHNYRIMVSHRSGETNDDFIADLAVAIGADFIKAGSLSRGERLAKYNRLMEIESMLKK